MNNQLKSKYNSIEDVVGKSSRSVVESGIDSLKDVAMIGEEKGVK